jgi:hypothetical protein
MTQLTDEDLGDLLTETFTAHEFLADPDRALAIAASAGRPSHRGRVLLGAAAAVALVAAGTSYVVTRGGDSTTPVSGPTRSTTTAGEHQPPLPPLQTDAGNRAAATRAADAAAASVPAYPDARESDAHGVPELNGQNVTISGPERYTVMRSRWWIATGATAKEVAQWYSHHAPAGFHSEGVGGQGGDGPWINDVDFSRPNGDLLPPSGVSIEVQTVDTPRGVGVRAVVDSVWPPARPRTSYVQDVTSIDVRIVETTFGRGSDLTVRRSYTIAAAARVLQIATAFDSLTGYPPFLHSCPALTDVTSYRIVFHTPTGDVTASYDSDACSMGMSVQRDGAPIEPALAGGDRVVALLHR